MAFDTEVGGQVVAALTAQGILMSIDDFGVGYTGLSLLRTLQASDVKIDRTFLAALPGSEQDRAKACSLIDLGHSLGCSVTAEGVEWQAATRGALVRAGKPVIGASPSLWRGRALTGNSALRETGALDE